MTMSFQELTSLPPDELGMVGFELARYSYYLQTVISFYQSRVMICRREIEKAVGTRLVDYAHVYGRDEKWIMAIADDEHATAWKRLEDVAHRALRSLEYLPNRLGEMLRAVLELQQSRRRVHGKI